jgi:D-alanyl-D-alanine carboxypeptidase
MSRRLTFGVLSLGVLSVLALASERSPYVESTLAKSAPEATLSSPVPPPTVSARAWGLFTPETGDLIAGDETDSMLPIASLTKLFTAYAVEVGELEEVDITITWSDLNTEGRAGKLVHGETFTARELLMPLLLESSNDAGEALRRTLGDAHETSLAALAESLGLTKTNIVDGSGLDAENASSVRDLARFYAYLAGEHPYPLAVTELSMFLTDEHRWTNNNPARELQGFKNGKHGYTEEAKRTYVGTFVLDDEEVGIVLLGSGDLVDDIEKLLAYARAR